MEKKIIAFIVFVCTSLLAFTQTDTKAKKLLEEVSAKYNAYQTIQSDFNFSVQQAGGEKHVDKGTLFLNKRKNQFRIVLSTQSIISDGNSTWSILNADREVQVSSADNNTDHIGPHNLFTFYKKGFNYKSAKDEILGKDILHTVELTPADTRTNYAKITLRINKNKHIHDVVMEDKSGNRYTYTINTLYVNHQIPTTTFTYNMADHPGYEIVDLR